MLFEIIINSIELTYIVSFIKIILIILLILELNDKDFSIDEKRGIILINNKFYNRRKIFIFFLKFFKKIRNENLSIIQFIN